MITPHRNTLIVTVIWARYLPEPQPMSLSPLKRMTGLGQVVRSDAERVVFPGFSKSWASDSAARNSDSSAFLSDRTERTSDSISLVFDSIARAWQNRTSSSAVMRRGFLKVIFIAGKRMDLGGACLNRLLSVFRLPFWVECKQFIPFYLWRDEHLDQAGNTDCLFWTALTR